MGEMAAILSPPANPPNLSTSSASSNRRPSAANQLPLLRRCRSLQELRQVHAAAVKSGLHSDLPTLTHLITFCCLHPSSASMSYAHHLFDQIPPSELQTPLLFNTLSRGYSYSLSPLRAISVFLLMLELNLLPDHYTFPSILRALAAAKSLSAGLQVHAMIIKLGFLSNSFVLPSLINFYAETGDFSKSRVVFQQAEGSSLCAVSFNAMIKASVKNNRPGEALQLFRQMERLGVDPTDVTLLCVLTSCALLGSLEIGKWAHRLARNLGFTSSVKVSTAVIDMYAKCGSLEDSLRVFREMTSRDTQAWNAVIVACALHGRADVAISLFHEMTNVETLEVEPDGVTFLGLLSACSHGGLVEEGLEFFRRMKVDYGVDPEVKHYGCMVDLLARAGRLHEAYEFIETLTVSAMTAPVLWRTLLGACSNYGELELGKRVFERILELESSHGGDYIIISNICAAAGEWEKVNAVRKKMRENGAVKLPGCSCIEIGGAVSEFFSGSGRGSQQEAAAVRQMLDNVAEQLKLHGYVPMTSLVLHEGMREEEKERSLRYHSEKMAMGFGLLNSPPGSTLRIVKNLRVCRDCHEMMKLVSDVFGREILLRDVNRFHHFREGKCSCGDYW